VIPLGQRPRTSNLQATPGCGCSDCARSYARLVPIGDETRFDAGNRYGSDGDAFEEAFSIFRAAEDLLRKPGMGSREVVRTWIHLRDIDRDCADLDRARRGLFRQRNIDPSPAGAGVGGGPAPDGHDLCLSVYAVQAPQPPAVTVMSAPTLDDTTLYGSDFARGPNVVEANKTALHVSGTASIDEARRTLHPEEVRLLRTEFRERGFDGFPNALVAAPICRPDLPCETEAMAVLAWNPREPSRRGYRPSKAGC
jgi:hypothetical protein